MDCQRYKNRTDPWAVQNIRQGKEEGVRYFYCQHASRILAFFHSQFNMQTADAEDALQEGFIRFVNAVRAGKLKDDGQAAGAFLAKICVNEALRILGKPPPLPLSSDIIEELGYEDPQAVWITELCYALCVARLFKRLQATAKNAGDCQSALTKRAAGWSMEEIAGKLGRSAQAVRQLLHDCRDKLRKLAQDENCLKDCQNM